jgi:hypothetical protein
LSRRKTTARTPSRPAARRRRESWHPRAALFLGGLLALSVAGWIGTRFLAGRHAPIDPLERMTAEDAFASGVRLGGAGHHLAALPYFLRAVSLAPDSWTAHENYASTLYNGAQETRIHMGKGEPGTRSSLERVTMIGESLRQTDEAMSWTREPNDQAVLLFQRAQVFHTFGFAIDALVEFHKATGMSPGNAPIVRAASRAEEQLRSGGTE